MHQPIPVDPLVNLMFAHSLHNSQFHTASVMDCTPLEGLKTQLILCGWICKCGQSAGNWWINRRVFVFVVGDDVGEKDARKKKRSAGSAFENSYSAM